MVILRFPADRNIHKALSWYHRPFGKNFDWFGRDRYPPLRAARPVAPVNTLASTLRPGFMPSPGTCAGSNQPDFTKGTAASDGA